MRLLLCEDERELAQALQEILILNQYSVDVVDNGADALDYLDTGNYDGLILDIMLPVLDGLSVLKELRKNKNHIPVLLLTAKSMIDDRVEGLDSGADDYLTKPFDVKELLARIRSMTRRKAPMSDAILEMGECFLDRAGYVLRGPKGEETLNNKEFQMMEMLMVNAGNIISAQLFMDRIWGYDSEAEINIVWVYLSYLRKKIARVSDRLRIKAIRNVGYRLEYEDGSETQS